MTSIYGHKWTSAYGQASNPNGSLTDTALVWAQGLSGVSAEDFSAGIEICVKSGDAWPPTLPEFREMCLGSSVNEFGLDYIPEYHRAQPERSRNRLLSNDDRDERRRKNLAGLRDLKKTLKQH